MELLISGLTISNKIEGLLFSIFKARGWSGDKPTDKVYHFYDTNQECYQCFGGYSDGSNPGDDLVCTMKK